MTTEFYHKSFVLVLPSSTHIFSKTFRPVIETQSYISHAKYLINKKDKQLGDFVNALPACVSQGLMFLAKE